MMRWYFLWSGVNPKHQNTHQSKIQAKRMRFAHARNKTNSVHLSVLGFRSMENGEWNSMEYMEWNGTERTSRFPWNYMESVILNSIQIL